MADTIVCICSHMNITVFVLFFVYVFQLLPPEDVLQLLHVSPQSKLYSRLVSWCLL